eukprot:COSAG02_NODE_827_length_16704_cov_8.649322_5_plen_124_part_00
MARAGRGAVWKLLLAVARRQQLPALCDGWHKMLMEEASCANRHKQKIDDATEANKPTALNGSYIKPITLEADLVANRVRIWMPLTFQTFRLFQQIFQQIDRQILFVRAEVFDRCVTTASPLSC